MCDILKHCIAFLDADVKLEGGEMITTTVCVGIKDPSNKETDL